MAYDIYCNKGEIVMENNPFRGCTVTDIHHAHVLLTGIPYDEGCSCGSGARLAPQTMRELSSFLPPLSKDGMLLNSIQLYDTGDIKKQDSSYFEHIEKESLKRFLTNKFPIFLGGDHSITIPLQRSFYQYCQNIKKIPVIIHLDAHPDICDEYDQSKYSHACTNFRSLEYGYLPEHLHLIGVRGFELQEVQYLNQHPEIHVYTATKILKEGIQPIIEQLKAMYDDRYAIYLSYDIDINDPAYAVGTGTPEAFGLPSIMVLELIIELFKNLPIAAFDIVEVSPSLDCNNMTSWLALKTLYEVFAVLIQKYHW